jgi:hypothetical protein
MVGSSVGRAREMASGRGCRAAGFDAGGDRRRDAKTAHRGQPHRSLAALARHDVTFKKDNLRAAEQLWPDVAPLLAVIAVRV